MSSGKEYSVGSTMRSRVSGCVGAVVLAMVFSSQSPIAVEPAPVRAAGERLTMGVMRGDLPYQDMGADGEAVGSEVELFSAAARVMAIPVDYVGGTEAELLGKLQAGEIDGMVGLPYRPERAAAFYFHLKPYAAAEMVAVVRRGAEVEELWGLRGKDLLVVEGTEAERFVLDYGLTKNLRREEDWGKCLEEMRKGTAYFGLVCDAGRAREILGGEAGGKWEVVSGGHGAPRGAVLGTGFDTLARDLEEGLLLTGEGKRAVAAVMETGRTHVEEAARNRLGWLPYAVALLFAMGFVMVLVVNGRVTRRARFLVSELEERIRQAEKSRKEALMAATGVVGKEEGPPKVAGRR